MYLCQQLVCIVGRDMVDAIDSVVICSMIVYYKILRFFSFSVGHQEFHLSWYRSLTSSKGKSSMHMQESSEICADLKQACLLRVTAVAMCLEAASTICLDMMCSR